MTLALRRSQAETRLLVGGPATGKSKALAERIDRLLRLDPNPYTVFIATPFPEGSQALYTRVSKLSGSNRANRYSFRTFKDVLAYQSRLLPSRAVLDDTYVIDLILGAYSAVGRVPEFLSPTHSLDRSVFVRTTDAWPFLASTLSHLDLLHPYQLLGDPSLPPLTADYLFIDDLHLLPFQAAEWINKHHANGTTVFSTIDPNYPGSTDIIAALDADVHHVKRRSRVPAPPSFTESLNVLATIKCDSLDAEVETIADLLTGPDCPKVLLCASPIVEAHVLLRLALRGSPPQAHHPHSVYLSRELRFVCTALEASLFGNRTAIHSLLTVSGTDLDKVFQHLKKSSQRVGLMRLLHSPDSFDLSDAVVESLKSFASAYESWRSSEHPVDALNLIFDWLRSTDLLPQPFLLDILSREFLYYCKQVHVTCSLRTLYERLIATLYHTHSASSSDSSPQVLTVSALPGNYYKTAHVSLTNTAVDDFTEEFLYLVFTHTGPTRTVTCSSLETSFPINISLGDSHV